MSDDDKQPVAYCAPGKRPIAELTLLLHGEQVSEVREHPWLEGMADAIVCKRVPHREIPFPTDVLRRTEEEMQTREFARELLEIPKPPVPPFCLVSVV